MSFENASAENRNQIITFPRVRRQQCCSFCRQVGHNLTTCNSNRLFEFETLCANQAANIDNPDDFKNWLSDNYMNDQLLLKAFAIKKFRVTTRANIIVCIDLITEYIYRTYKNQTPNENENLENDLITFLSELRNVREREAPEEINDVDGVRRIALREMIYYMLFTDMIYTIREEYNAQRKFNILSSIENNENENINENCECNICWEEKEVKNFVKLGCNHEFCKDCIIKTFRAEQRVSPCCALCRAEVKSIKSRTNLVQTELAELVA
jgi:hypothetical protein